MKQTKNIEEIIEKYSVQSSPLKSRLYIGLGSLCLLFALIGIWLPGWPTISWAVPAAFLFSLSSKKLFRWCLSNPYFGPALFDYYATGKTIPKHAKLGVIALMSSMVTLSTYFVYKVSYPADPGYGAGTIAALGLVGVWYLIFKVKTRPETPDH